VRCGEVMAEDQPDHTDADHTHDRVIYSHLVRR
jgi:hypothetical protein